MPAPEDPTRLLPAFWALGAEQLDLAAGRLAHRPGPVVEPAATFLHRVRPHGPADLDATLDAVGAHIGAPCPRVFLDASTPVWVEAELVERDWTVESMLFAVLAPDRQPVGAPAAGIAPREATDADWATLRLLFRADHEEEDRRAGRPLRPSSRTDAVVDARRSLPEPVRYFVLEAGGVGAGFVAGWPGDGGPGLVEDLYVTPGSRGRGGALALLRRAVAWARDDGVGPGRTRAVAIGADPADTPKHLYRRLGFAPAAMLRAAQPPLAGTEGATRSPMGTAPT